MKRQKWQGKPRVSYRQAMSSFQYLMLLKEWERCVKIVEIVADLLVQAKERLEKYKVNAIDENVGDAYWVSGKIIDEILNGDVFSRRWTHVRATAMDQLRGALGHREGQLIGWRKAYSEVVIENAALAAKVAKLQSMIDEMIAEGKDLPVKGNE